LNPELQIKDDLLSADHAELDDLLKGVFNALDSRDSAAVFDRLDLFWARLAMHIRAEHLHLFPAVLEYSEEMGPAAFDIRDKLELLKHDHDFFMRELARAVKLMRAVTEGNAAATCIEIRSQLLDIEQSLSDHNRIEETEVYPLMQAVTAHTGSNDLIARVKKELDNLPPRFRKGGSE